MGVGWKARNAGTRGVVVAVSDGLLQQQQIEPLLSNAFIQRRVRDDARYSTVYHNTITLAFFCFAVSSQAQPGILAVVGRYAHQGMGRSCGVSIVIGTISDRVMRAM